MNMSEFQNDHYEDMLTGIDASREKILRKYFNSVCDADDWKKPINAYITFAERTLVETAIMYYTGTKAKFVPMHSDMLNVKALGYRMGPCGPQEMI